MLPITNCLSCQVQLNKYPRFYLARIRAIESNPLLLMCHFCFQVYSCSLGKRVGYEFEFHPKRVEEPACE